MCLNHRRRSRCRRKASRTGNAKRKFCTHPAHTRSRAKRIVSALSSGAISEHRRLSTTYWPLLFRFVRRFFLDIALFSFSWSAHFVVHSIWTLLRKINRNYGYRFITRHTLILLPVSARHTHHINNSNDDDDVDHVHVQPRRVSTTMTWGWKRRRKIQIEQYNIGRSMLGGRKKEEK